MIAQLFLILASCAFAAPALVVPAPRPIERIELVKNRIIFDDGDTIHYKAPAANGLGQAGQILEFRLLGYDTPETMHPHHGMFYDQPGGKEASALTRRTIESAESVAILTRRELDKYSRILAHLLVDDTLLGTKHLRAGLAYEGVAHYGDNGFPEQARQMMDAWEQSPIYADIKAGRQPAMMAPHRWRYLHLHHDLAVPLETWNAMSEEQKTALANEARRRAAERAAKP